MQRAHAITRDGFTESRITIHDTPLRPLPAATAAGAAARRHPPLALRHAFADIRVATHEYQFYSSDSLLAPMRRWHWVVQAIAAREPASYIPPAPVPLVKCVTAQGQSRQHRACMAVRQRGQRRRPHRSPRPRRLVRVPSPITDTKTRCVCACLLAAVGAFTEPTYGYSYM